MDGINLLWNERILLIDGIISTLYISSISLVLSILGGFLVGFLRNIKNPVINVIGVLYMEVFRIIPLMVWLFLAFFTLPTLLGLTNISGETAVIIVFTLWGSAEMGDLVRGALASLPVIQRESGTALGLSGFQLFRYILFPQAIRRLLPGIVNMATRLIKTSSMASLVGVTEIIARGRHIIERTTEPFIVFTFIFFLFFFICWPLSIFAKHLEKKTI